MTQAELDREVARATGETMSEVQHLGFTILEPLPEEPLVIDWDAGDELRVYRFRNPRRRKPLLAAA